MKTALHVIGIVVIGLLALPLATPFVRAQTGSVPWANRERVMRAFDVETTTAMAALEKTILEALDTEEQRAAFVAALEANLFPPKTGAARVQALDDLKDRAERELGPDSPVLQSITEERQTAETAVREETIRQEELLRLSSPVPVEK